jgi:plastocyanin
MALRRFPRIFLVVPGLLAGLLVPALTSSAKPLPPGAVGMTDGEFARDSITLHVGERLTLINNSGRVHIIGPGLNNYVYPEPGVPLKGFHLMQSNNLLVTGPWKTPGTFTLTCTVHPGMNLRVVVKR